LKRVIVPLVSVSDAFFENIGEGLPKDEKY
jgi:hypothetical protein